MVKNQIFILLKKELYHLEHLLKRKGFENAILIIIAYAIVGLLSNYYIYGFATDLIAFESSGEYLKNMVLFISFLISLGFNIYFMNDIIYSEEYIMILSYPIKYFSIVTVKAVVLYFLNLCTFNIMIFSTYITLFQNRLQLWDLVITLMGVLLYSIVLSLILINILKRIGSKLRIRPIIKSLLLVFVLIISIVLITIINIFDYDIQLITVTVFRLFAIFGNNKTIFSYFLIYIAAPCFIYYYYFKYFVDNIRFFDSDNNVVNKFKTIKYSKKKPLISLVFDDIYKYVSNIPLLINTSVNLFLFLLGSILIFANNIVDISDTFNIYKILIEDNVDKLPFIFALIGGLSCPCSVSLSLEGKTIWQKKSFPIKKGSVFKSKLIAQLIFTIPIVLVSSILIFYHLEIGLIYKLLSILQIVIFLIISGILGNLVNILFVNYKWESQIAIIKRSSSMIIYQLINVAIIIAFMLISNLAGNNIATYIYIIILQIMLMYTLYLNLKKWEIPCY